MTRIQSFAVIAVAILVAFLAGITLAGRRSSQRVTIINTTAADHTPGPRQITGIYEHEVAGLVTGVELRQNGTGMIYQRQKYRDDRYGEVMIHWVAKDGAITVNNISRWKIDGEDLVDLRQNRWERLSY